MSDNAYQRIYQLKRYHRRRRESIAKLGGKCVHCKSNANLQIDHVKPESKSIDLGKMWSVSEKRFQEELSKCQLLCQTCHGKKSAYDTGKKPRKHGSLTMYDRGCRCPPCKGHKNKHHREYKKRVRSSTV